MPLKIFIIDDSRDYRSLLAHHVTAHWPDAEVKNYDPLASGRLPDTFSGAGCDLVLLGHPVGGGDALDWLRNFVSVRHFPPVIVIGSGDERQIVESIRSGASDYLSKRHLTHDRLVRLIEAAVEPVSADADTGRFFFGPDDASLPSLKGYDFRRRLAANDVSAVFLARERATRRPVVLKVLRQMPDAGGEVVFDRFLQEYELIAKVRHRNIVEILDLGIADDHAFIAMEYCSQGSLKRRIARGLTPEQAFSYMRQIAAALGALHAAGIMHRDLKPTNVMFRDDDSLVLIDFGLAKQAQLQADITGAGEIFGTPYYMSPEQGHADEVDERGDIYSLGVIYYEMLTGRKPFQGSDAMSVIIQHRQAPVPELPPEFARYQPAVDLMLAKSPAERFQSAEEILGWQPDDAASSVA